MNDSQKKKDLLSVLDRSQILGCSKCIFKGWRRRDITGVRIVTIECPKCGRMGPPIAEGDIRHRIQLAIAEWNAEQGIRMTDVQAFEKLERMLGAEVRWETEKHAIIYVDGRRWDYWSNKNPKRSRWSRTVSGKKKTFRGLAQLLNNIMNAEPPGLAPSKNHE